MNKLFIDETAKWTTRVSAESCASTLYSSLVCSRIVKPCQSDKALAPELHIFFHGSGAGSFLPTSCLGPLGSHQTRSNVDVFILSTYFLHTFYLLSTYFLQFKKLFYKVGPKPAPDNQKRAGSGSSSGSATLVNRHDFLSLSIGSAVCIWLNILLFHLCPHLP